MAKASTKANVVLSLTDRISGKAKKIGATLNKLAVGAGAMGAAVSASLGVAAVKFAKVGDQLDKMSDKTGFSAQALSELGFAAGQGGASIEQLDKSLQGMARFSVDASRGLATATDSLNELGIAQSDFDKMSPEDRFNTLTTAISGIKDPTKKAGLALKVFGRSGRDLLPMLKEGPEGIAALREEAVSLGITMNDETAASAAALTDAMGRLRSQLSYVVAQIGAALAPALVMISTYITPILSKVISFVKANKMLIVIVGAVAATLAVVAGAMAALGVIIPLIASALSIMFNPWVIGIGLAVAAFVGLIGYFVDFEAVIASVTDLSNNLWGDMATGWDGIVAAISSGDFGLAFEIAMKAAQIAVFEGLDRLWGGWRDFAEGVLDVIRNVVKTIGELWSKGVDWIADKIIRVGMAVGLIDEATGEQMLKESAKIGAARTESIGPAVDSTFNSLVEELKKDRATLSSELGELTEAAIEAAPKAAAVAAAEVATAPTVTEPLLASKSGATGGTSSAAVVSLLAKDTVQKDQLAELKSINENISNLNQPEVGFGA